MIKNLVVLLMLVLCSKEYCYSQQMKPGTVILLATKSAVNIDRAVDSLLNGSEEDANSVLQYYRIKQDIAKVNSVTDIISRKYPRGEAAAIQATLHLHQQSDMVEVERLFDEFVKKFDNQQVINLYPVMADRAAKSRSLEHFIKYWGKIQDTRTKDMILKLCGPMLIQRDPNRMKILFDKKLSEFNIEKDNLKEYYDLLEIYSDIYMELKDYPKALNEIERVFLFRQEKSDDLLQKYANLLSLNKQYEKSFVIVDSLIRKGKGNEELKNELTISFNQLFPSNDVEHYLQGIQSKLKMQITKDIAKDIIKEKAPDFLITDAKGKSYRLADFKGKYLILDFWATWCGPCKKSFPAMQQAVNKFEKDTDVKFLFIHTWERSKNPIEDAVTYLRENNYTFDLYMDLKDDKTRVNPAISQFGVDGIPAKFVIDPQGFIRYRGAGFDGGDDTLVSELSAIIEYIKRK
ncbi:TlpA family protein disulfide reductase [Sphingobacterium sp. MYb388]|uniref:TlpA family protein disulfide reductase n=1 Tax=Sphingobacterium sp. MYb388 TaxID=2745437 RepID=UPI003098882E